MMPFVLSLFMCFWCACWFDVIPNLIFLKGVIKCAYTCTVNSEIFMRVLFSQNFAYGKFRENKILLILRNHSAIY